MVGALPATSSAPTPTSAASRSTSRKPEGIELLRRLIAESDVVIENFTPRVMANFGLEWPTIRELNPRCVLVRMPAFGLSGPWRDNTGFAQTMEQVTGLAWLTGHTWDQPRIQRGPSDPNAGMHAAFAVLVGLAERDATGEGCQLEVTMVEGALNAAAELAIEYTRVRQPCSSATATARPAPRRRASTRARASTGGSRCRSRPTSSGGVRRPRSAARRGRRDPDARDARRPTRPPRRARRAHRRVGDRSRRGRDGRLARRQRRARRARSRPAPPASTIPSSRPAASTRTVEHPVVGRQPHPDGAVPLRERRPLAARPAPTLGPAQPRDPRRPARAVRRPSSRSSKPPASSAPAPGASSPAPKRPSRTPRTGLHGSVITRSDTRAALRVPARRNEEVPCSRCAPTRRSFAAASCKAVVLVAARRCRRIDGAAAEGDDDRPAGAVPRGRIGDVAVLRDRARRFARFPHSTSSPRPRTHPRP